MTSAVFLDRDGTVTRYVEYCRRAEDLVLLPGAGEAIRTLNDAGLTVLLITNQSAVGRGWLTLAALETIHEAMRSQLAESGARIDGIYVCPHHPKDACACRKPKPGLLRQAAAERGIALAESYIVGDRWLDVHAGAAVGSRTVLVTSGHPAEPSEGLRADYEASTLREAAAWIVRRHAKARPREGALR